MLGRPHGARIWEAEMWQSRLQQGGWTQAAGAGRVSATPSTVDLNLGTWGLGDLESYRGG